MNKITFKIALPIILTGLFAIIVFVALDYGKMPNEVYFVFIFLSVYVFLFGFAVGQNISSPLEKLLKRATELSQGDLKTRVYLETKDELGELSRVFNKIAQDLEESKNANLVAQETIDIKVKARTQALEETIYALEQKVKNRTIELDKAIGEVEKAREELKSKEAELANIKLNNENLKKNPSKKNKTTQEVQDQEIVDKPEQDENQEDISN